MYNGHKAIFNGHDLSELIVITSLYRGISLGRSSDTRGRYGKKGMDFLGHRSEMVTYEMEFIKRPGVKDVNERLIQILNVNEPKELLLSAMMGKALYAFPRGNIKTEEKSSLGEGVIVWEIPDGVAYSEQEYDFKNRDYEGNRLNYITIDNPGTEPMELELEAKFNSALRTKTGVCARCSATWQRWTRSLLNVRKCFLTTTCTQTMIGQEITGWSLLSQIQSSNKGQWVT